MVEKMKEAKDQITIDRVKEKMVEAVENGVKVVQEGRVGEELMKQLNIEDEDEKVINYVPVMEETKIGPISFLDDEDECFNSQK